MNLGEIFKQILKESKKIIETFDYEDDNDFGDEYNGEDEGFGDDGFWGSQGAGILPICTSTKRILIALRSQDVEEPNSWGIWGGAIDSKETSPKNGALREFKEETRYTGSIDLIDAFVFKQNSFSYFNFIGLLPEEFEPRLDWENSDYKWVTYEELLNTRNQHFGLTALIKNSNKIIRQHSI